MNMKKVTLAAAILFALTGCGSSGGGSSNSTPNSEVNNNQATQTQVEKQKAEVEALKNQLVQAQASQKQAEDKLKSAEKTHNQNLTAAKNNLASAQANLTKVQSALKQAESKLTAQQKTQTNLQNQLTQAQQNLKNAEAAKQNAEKALNTKLQNKETDLAKAQENLTASKAELAKATQALKTAQANLLKNEESNKALQNQLNEASQKLSTAQQEKLLAEKELNDKLAEENKLMTRAEVLDFALHNGLNNTDSEEFADEFKNKPKAQVINELLDTHKIIAMKNLARRYGLPEVDVRAFTKENKNKTLEEAAKLLDSQKEEIAKKRETLLNDLFTIAKEKGLEDWEANNFVYGRNHTDKEQALKDLNNYLNEKAERETKLNELIQLAKEKGLEDWEASNFANSHINMEKAKALEELNKLATEKEQQRLQTEKENQIRELAEQYKNNYFPNDWDFSAWDFAQKYKDKTIDEAKKELDSIKEHREHLTKLVEQYKKDYFQSLYYEVSDFVQKYKNKTLEEAKKELDSIKARREEVTELAKILTELNLSSDEIEGFINTNTLLSSDEAKSNLDAKVTDSINRLKAGGFYNNPLDKPLGFLAKEDSITKTEPVVENDREVAKKTITTYSDIYNQKYSVITGKYNKTVEPYTDTEYYYEGDSQDPLSYRTRKVSKIRTNETYTVYDGTYPYNTNGFKTPVDKFHSEGKATYTGVAFDAKKQGELSYTVNFADRKGSGKITGLDHIGDITLQEAEIYNSASLNSMRVTGTAFFPDASEKYGIDGKYDASFFGPNAEEIAGKATFTQRSEGMLMRTPDESIKEKIVTTGQQSSYYGYPDKFSFDIGFGGTRGEIQK